MEDHTDLVGRGIRMCGDSDLVYPDEWTVIIQTYVTDPPRVASMLTKIETRRKRASHFIQDAVTEMSILKGMRGQPAVQARRLALFGCGLDFGTIKYAKKLQVDINEE